MKRVKKLLLLLSVSSAITPAIHALSWQNVTTWATEATDTSVRFLKENKKEIANYLASSTFWYSCAQFGIALGEYRHNSLYDIANNNRSTKKINEFKSFRNGMISAIVTVGLYSLHNKWVQQDLNNRLAQEEQDRSNRFAQLLNNPPRPNQRPVPNQIAPENLTTRFTDIVGDVPEDIQILQDMIQNPNQYEDIGRPKGIILHGPPGTGKTLLARAVAGECGCPFFVRPGGNFNQTFRGTGTANLNNLFNRAREQGTPERPSIIFIDEFDALAARRTHGMDTWSERDNNTTVNTLLNLMDGFTPLDNVIVIGATNNIGCIDEAVKRAGRFELHIEVPLPNQPQRLALWNHYLNNNSLPVGIINQDFRNQLAQQSNNFTGADIKSLIQNYNLRSRFRRQAVNAATFSNNYNAYVQEHAKGTALALANQDTN